MSKQTHDKPRWTAAPIMAVVVVGAQFCSPRALRLTLAMNLMLPGGTVTDDASGGGVVLRMDVPVFLRIFDRFVLVNEFTGRPLISMQRQTFSLAYREWEAFRGDSSHSTGGQLLFTAKKSAITQLTANMDIFLASNRTQQVCDFRMKCTFAERSADIYRGNSNTLIAQIWRRYSFVLGRDTFSIAIVPNVDYVFISALAVMLQEIHLARQRQST